MTVDNTLERLDTILDTVDELIRDLPLSRTVKMKLASQVYALWMDIEEQTEVAQ
jgi:hypothetical protein